MDLELKRRIEQLNTLIDRMQQRMAKQFGRSAYCILGNDREHQKWVEIKYNETALLSQDDEGRSLLPTWDYLTKDLYSALHRVQTVLFDKNQIGARYQGNRKLLADVIETDDWERLHDTTLGDNNMCVIAALRIQDAWLQELRKQKEESSGRNKGKQQQEKGLDRGGSTDDLGGRQTQPGKESGSTDHGVTGESAVPGMGTPEDPGETTGPDVSALGGNNELKGDSGENSETGEYSDQSHKESSEENSESGDSGTDGDAEAQDHYDAVPEESNSIDNFQAGVDAEQALNTAIQAARNITNANQTSIEDAIKEAEEALSRAEQASNRLDDQAAYDTLMEDNGPSETLRKAAELAAHEVKEQAERLSAWGVEQGVLKRMDPKESMRLAKLMRDSPELQRIAELIGSNRIAIQRRKTRDRLAHGPTLRLGIEHGNDLNKLVSSQKLQMLVAPDLFKSNFFNKKLRQYKTKMEQVLERGTGVIWVDSSGSMWSGRPYTYSQVAKATAISLAEYFHDEGRYCVIGLFDHGVREIIEIPPDISEVELLTLKVKIAENNYGGGTDFFAPIIAGFEKIRESRYLEKADQVLITDGQCYLSDEQVKQIKELQDETKVTIQTILMPGGFATQMQEFGPVESVRTALNDANKLALDIITRMDDTYGVQE